MSVRRVRIREIARQRIEPVAVDSSGAYRMIGLLNRGRGIFERGVLRGTETSYTNLYEVRPGDLIYSKLFGWEGSIALASAHHKGSFVSSEFPVFEFDREKVSSRYLAHVICSESFVAQMADSTTGMGQRRQRVNPERFMAVEFPLPAIDEQRRVAGRLDIIARSVNGLGVVAQRRGNALALLPRFIETTFKAELLPRVPVRELYSPVSDVVHPWMNAAPATRFVGLEHLEPHTGRRLTETPLGTLTGRKLRFMSGDVLYGYLRPYQNKVWSSDGPGLCSVEQYVLRPRPRVNANLLSYALRSQETLVRVNQATHRLQLPRIRMALLGAIDVPDVRQARESLLRHLDEISSNVVRLDGAQTRHRASISALLPAARNEEFARLTSE